MQIWRRFVGIVEMIASFQLWYGSLDNADKENQTDPINARERDNTIYDACKLQNTNTQYIPDKKPQKAALSRIMESITFLHEHYQAMPSLQDITCDDVKNKHVCLVEYALQYFNTSEMNSNGPLWSKYHWLIDGHLLSFWLSCVCVHLLAMQQQKDCLVRWKWSKQIGEIIWMKLGGPAIK